MGLTNILSKIFELNNIDYHYNENSVKDYIQSSWTANTPTPNNLANITLLKTAESIIFAILPASHHLNIAKIIDILKIPVHYLNVSAIHSLQEQCEQLNITEIMKHHNIQVIIDLEVSDLNTVLFKNDSEKNYLSVESQNLEKLIIEIPIGCQFSEPKPEFMFHPNLTMGAPRLDIANKIENITTLPILPEIATQILQLQNNADATVESLANIVKQDPSLTSLILKYANSALFGQRGSVDSVYDAILRVLGFDTVLYLAIGLTMGNSFKLDREGPLGSKHIWEHAVFTAAICQKLSSKCPKEFRPSPGQAYLAGLLHDIGFLVLANSFETEYFWLNKLIDSKPEVPMTVIEHQLLGIHHTDLGKTLMTNWNMPEFLVIAVSEHHNENYLGKHCEISGLVLLVDRALKSHGHSDAFSDVLPEELVSRLGLTRDDIKNCINEVLECSESLDLMVSAMAS
ncbi:MAG: HDOD domain-containing protein [Gammaproteobacteria bacterium]